MNSSQSCWNLWSHFFPDSLSSQRRRKCGHYIWFCQNPDVVYLKLRTMNLLDKRWLWMFSPSWFFVWCIFSRPEIILSMLLKMTNDVTFQVLNSTRLRFSCIILWGRILIVCLGRRNMSKCIKIEHNVSVYYNITSGWKMKKLIKPKIIWHKV